MTIIALIEFGNVGITIIAIHFSQVQWDQACLYVFKVCGTAE